MTQPASPLPKLPIDVLEIHSIFLKVFIAASLKFAETIGIWRRPSERSETSAEKMGVLDQLYWIFKAKHLIEGPGPKVDTEAFLEDTLPLTTRVLSTKEDSSLSLSACGDILRSNVSDADRDMLYSDVWEDIFGADISMANYEAPVTRGPLVEEVIGQDGPPIECASEAQFVALTGHKGRFFDVLSLANNHMLDLGLEGVMETLRAAKARGTGCVGLNLKGSIAGSTLIVERNGFRIGIAACTFGLNGKPQPESNPTLVNVADLCPKNGLPDCGEVKQLIDDARARNSDFVVVHLHWGHEFEMFPRASQIALAHELAEYGADTIIGHHPHVAQPIELYQCQRDDGRIVPIAYSLGSLVWGFTDRRIATSKVLRLDLAQTEKGVVPQKISIQKVVRTEERAGRRFAPKIRRLTSETKSLD